jgi:hypothetical protein
MEARKNLLNSAFEISIAEKKRAPLIDVPFFSSHYYLQKTAESK